MQPQNGPGSRDGVDADQLAPDAAGRAQVPGNAPDQSGWAPQPEREQPRAARPGREQPGPAAAGWAPSGPVQTGRAHVPGSAGPPPRPEQVGRVGAPAERAVPATGDSAERAQGAWAAAPGSPSPTAPTTGGVYGKASVPLNTIRPASPAPGGRAAVGRSGAGGSAGGSAGSGEGAGSAPAADGAGAGAAAAGRGAPGGRAGKSGWGEFLAPSPGDGDAGAAVPGGRGGGARAVAPGGGGLGPATAGGVAAGMATAGAGGVGTAAPGGGGAPAGVVGGAASGPSGDGAPPTVGGSARRSRTRLVLGLGVVLVLVMGLAVVGLVKPGPVKSWLGAETATGPTATATVDPTPTPVLVAASGGGTAPSAAKVKAALDPLIKSAALGNEVHASVLDVVTGDVLYARNADVPTTPASTTKLLTAAAVLAARGPAYRLSTRAVAGSAPGEVVLVGGGDPTLSAGAKGQFPGAARLDLLAAQVKKALGGARPTRVLVDTSLFTGPETGLGWDSDDITPLGQVSRIQSLMTNAGRIKPVHNENGGDPRYSDPAVAAGKAFAKLLGAPTGSVKRGKAPDGAQLGVVQSPPLVQITDWMLEQSDNTIAEAMGRQVALAAGKPASFDGASEAIIDKLRDLGLPGDEADLYDASGLSRHNGISPTLLTSLLALAASGRQPALTGIFGGLPVAGWSGTLEKRFVSPRPNQVAQGVVRAKTGTLSGVNTMAGELVTEDGRLLVFAIMASGSGNATTAKAALDKVPARLVACGC